MENPVTFKNRNGETLFGMTFCPEVRSSRRKVGIIISVNAIKYRIGTFRLHTLLARHLSRIGYYVMYFDPAGIGDSEGGFEQKYLIEHYRDIQKGKYGEDIMDAISFFKSQFQLDSLVLFGLCGGAISMLIAAARDSRVDGLILLGLPVLVENIEGKNEEFDEASVITSQEQASRTLLSLLRKSINIHTWIKVFTFKIAWKKETRIAVKALTVLVTKHIEKLRNFIRKKQSMTLGNTPVSQHPQFNMHFQHSFAKFTSREGKILFVFAELDFVTWLFKSEFQDTALGPYNPYEHLYEIHVIKRANHIFSAKDSQLQLGEILEKWLQQNYSIG